MWCRVGPVAARFALASGGSRGDAAVWHAGGHVLRTMDRWGQPGAREHAHAGQHAHAGSGRRRRAHPGRGGRDRDPGASGGSLAPRRDRDPTGRSDRDHLPSRQRACPGVLRGRSVLRVARVRGNPGPDQLSVQPRWVRPVGRRGRRGRSPAGSGTGADRRALGAVDAARHRSGPATRSPAGVLGDGFFHAAAVSRQRRAGRVHRGSRQRVRGGVQPCLHPGCGAGRPLRRGHGVAGVLRWRCRAFRAAPAAPGERPRQGRRWHIPPGRAAGPRRPRPGRRGRRGTGGDRQSARLCPRRFPNTG